MSNIILQWLLPHRRIHTGKRPYKCHDPGCGKSFVHKMVLTKHMKMVHDSTIRAAGGVSLESQDHNIAEVSSPSSSVSSSNTPPYDSSFTHAPSLHILPKFPCNLPHLALNRFQRELSSRRDSAISLGSSPHYAYTEAMRYPYPSFYA